MLLCKDNSPVPLQRTRCYITLVMASDMLEHASPDDHIDADSKPQPDMPDSVQDRSQSDEKSPAASTKDQSDSATKRANAKDPSRPRRKKARRACYACQRAHLTCGESA